MARFNAKTVTARAATGPIITETVATGRTHEGAPGFARDARSELFLLAVANFVGQKTFYEDAKSRDERFEKLIAAVAVEDPAWLSRFLVWLRTDANMRTASLVGAAEAAKAMIAAKIPGARSIVKDVLRRADEPGEMIGYWLSTHGRKLPQPIRRGVADAVGRLYNEFNTLKYDTPSHAIRFADVLELTHPKADWPGQNDLFRFILARRHGRAEIPEVDQRLPMVLANTALRAAAAEMPELLLDTQRLKAAGMTWEDVKSLAGSKVNQAKLWEALVPTMGYMALLRNLHNLDEAGVSVATVKYVSDFLANEVNVRASKQFPFRFYSAFKAVQASQKWGWPLTQALNFSLGNIPELPGRTLVLVDLSGSMSDHMSDRSQLQRREAAALFGGGIALRNPTSVDLVRFGSQSAKVSFTAGESLLNIVSTKLNMDMGGTSTGLAVDMHYNKHDRVIIVTDEQAHVGIGSTTVPASVPIYTWNLAGYRMGHGPGGNGRYTFAGLTDQAFSMIPLLERGQDQGWPF